jgi:hypothetical protein
MCLFVYRSKLSKFATLELCTRDVATAASDLEKLHACLGTKAGRQILPYHKRCLWMRLFSLASACAATMHPVKGRLWSQMTLPRTYVRELSIALESGDLETRAYL